jgi:hypothetical protein
MSGTKTSNKFAVPLTTTKQIALYALLKYNNFFPRRRKYTGVVTATGSSISAKPRSNYCKMEVACSFPKLFEQNNASSHKDTITISTALVRIILMNTSNNLKYD